MALVMKARFLRSITMERVFPELHEFAGGPGDGQWSSGSLIISGSTLYGMTRFGGDNGEGTIFKINTNGSGYDLLHEFAGFNGDGMDPNGSLIISGSTLYGMNTYGGTSNMGTIFKIETDGGGYALLHEFIGGTDDGESPSGSLISSGSILFAMACWGGENNKGVIFSLPLNTISGTVTHEGSPLVDVVMEGLPGNPVTNGSGYYSTTVDFRRGRGPLPPPASIIAFHHLIQIIRASIAIKPPTTRQRFPNPWSSPLRPPGRSGKKAGPMPSPG